MHDRFDGPTFLPYVKELYRKFGKAAILLCDRASQQHRTKTLGGFLGKKKDTDIRLVVFLPKGSLYLNPVEACWQRGKRELLASEHYETFAMMRDAVSKHYRTVRFGLNLYLYLHRSPSKNLMNFGA